MTANVLPHDTTNLRLRRLREGDLLRFQGYRSDAELGRYQGWLPMDDATAGAFLRQMANSPFCPRGAWFQLGVASLECDTLIGDIGIHLHSGGDVAEIGFTLAREAQGRGLATEAVAAAVALVFAHTGAARVVGITDTRNAASVRLLERVGLRRFATLDAVFHGEVCLEHHHVRHRQPSAALTLRAATTEDAAAVARVLVDSRRELMPFAPSTHSDASVHQWVRDTLIPSGAVTVAVADGAVAGVLAISSTAQGGWIDHLYVHPTQVARGFGKVLLAHALATLLRPVQLYTFQANHHARAFYEHHGFSATTFSDGAGNEERCPDVLYRWPGQATSELPWLA